MWSLTPGARIALSAPANHFNLMLGRPDYLLLAGGIGVTPIFTHALALAEANARFRLIYACRSRADLALAKELAERLGDRLELFLSEEGKRVDIAAEIQGLDAHGEFYVCGPIGMLEALEDANVGMIFDCRRGECGLCALPILAADGIVDHRDVFFSDAEKAGNAKLCTCVSRVYGASITVDTGDR